MILLFQFLAENKISHHTVMWKEEGGISKKLIQFTNWLIFFSGPLPASFPTFSLCSAQLADRCIQLGQITDKFEDGGARTAILSFGLDHSTNSRYRDIF